MGVLLLKAIIHDVYGPPDVLQLKEVEKPVPKNREVLVRIHGASVNYGDLTARNFKHISHRTFNMPLLFWLIAKLDFGLNQPRRKILGSEFSGIIESTGKDVTRFKQGDPVFGYLAQKMGAYAEYLCVPETTVMVLKPDNIGFEEAAALPMGAIMALNLLGKARIQPGQKVLINGASGGLGSAAVQIAKYLGAEVTGVCGTPRLEFVRSLGADHVIDYTKENFTEKEITYDLIFDVLGKSSFSKSKRVLNPNGLYLRASFKMKQLFQMFWTTLFPNKGRKVLCAIAPGSLADLNAVRKLIEKGALKAIIDKRFSLEQAAEAHRYVENGHKKGQVVITFPA